MKNYSFSIILILGFSFLGITSLKYNYTNKTKEDFLQKKATAIDCNAYYNYDPSVKAFVVSPTAPLFIRKNVNTISTSDWKKFQVHMAK